MAANTLVLIMLSSDAPSPCHTFGHNNKSRDKLSAENLKNILLWAADAKPKIPELFFVAGPNEPLELSIASVLEDMGQVITPLLPIERQESLGIPFSVDQTVIVNGLDEIISQADSIAGRPVILHIENTEIDKLAEGLLSVQDYIGNVSLRLRDIHLWQERDIHAYEQQLAGISNIGLMKKAMGTAGKLGLLNLGILDSPAKSRMVRCPAGTGFVVIGPDGYIYPCPAFYHAGREYSMGPVYGIAKKPAALGWNLQRCGICNMQQCPGCPFLESNESAGRGNVCKVYEAERHAAQNLIPRVAGSAYLFDCLRTLRTRDCASKSRSEGGEALAAGQQLHDVTFDEFIRSLQDLKSAAKHIAAEPFENDSYDAVLNRWLELSEIPSNSQRGIFRRRVLETLTDLRRLRNHAVLAGQSRSLIDAWP
jgi:radical SAM protein with 4Fe4S-binding SPASM domain